MDDNHCLREACVAILDVTSSLCAEGGLTISVTDTSDNVVAATGPLRSRTSSGERLAAIYLPTTGEIVGTVGVATDAPHTEILGTILALQISSRIEDLLSRAPSTVVGDNRNHHTSSRIEEMEYKAIVNSLWLTKGAVNAAAKHLGISRSTMYRKLKLYGIGVTTQKN